MTGLCVVVISDVVTMFFPYLAAEEAMKARREIADYIKNKRTERARIRVSM